MKRVKFIKTNNSLVDTISISDGSFIVATDSRDIYIDYDNQRFSLSGIVYLETEEEKDDILIPINKIYYIKESKKFYVYNYDNLDWVCINDSPKTTVLNFPTLSYDNDSDMYYYQWSGLWNIQILDENGESIVPTKYIRNISNNITRIEFDSNYYNIDHVINWKLLCTKLIIE